MRGGQGEKGKTFSGFISLFLLSSPFISEGLPCARHWRYRVGEAMRRSQSGVGGESLMKCSKAAL
jgi:hypothetical protein